MEYVAYLVSCPVADCYERRGTCDTVDVVDSAGDKSSNRRSDYSQQLEEHLRGLTRIVFACLCALD